ncbi:MAG TPA: hypothetical protein QF761_14665, partial [Pirellulales bacterium]|nr:hypothetical protein [Pirellulales bacterium]
MIPRKVIARNLRHDSAFVFRCFCIPLLLYSAAFVLWLREAVFDGLPQMPTGGWGILQIEP